MKKVMMIDMTKHWLLKALVLLTVVGGLNATGANAALVSTVWTAGTNDPEPGTLGASTVSLDTSSGATKDPGYDLSGANPAFDAQPLSTSEFMVYYAREEDWTATFAAPVVDLYLYFFNWRPGTYTFDKAFSIIEQTGGVSSAGLVLTVPTDPGLGILEFSGSTGSLGVVSTVTGDGGALNILTFAEDDAIQGGGPVPEPSTYALGLIGLAGLGLLAWRRRK